MAEAQVVVVGVGNTLLRDEGFGVHVVRELKRQGVPKGVRVVEAGVGGFNLLDSLAGVSKAVVVDAAEMGAGPGCLRRFTPDQVAPAQKTGRFSLHQVDLLEVLELSRALGQRVEAVIIGVQPAVVEWGEGLSDTLQARVPEVVKMVRAEIEDHFSRICTEEKGV